MGRQRQFIEEEVIEQAIDLFWLRGYHCSLAEVEKALGIGRKSLYNTFGSKDGLFKAALNRYKNKTQEMFEKTYVKHDNTIACIEVILLQIKSNLTQTDRIGCFATNTILEANHDDQIARITAAFESIQKEMFSLILQRGIEHGHLELDTPVSYLVNNLCNQIFGLGVKARFADIKEDEIDDVIHFSLESIRSYLI